MLEYEYEPEMEESYRADFFKSFKKTVEKGYFSFIIIDAVNDKVCIIIYLYSGILEVHITVIPALIKGFTHFLALLQTPDSKSIYNSIIYRNLQNYALPWHSNPGFRSLLDDFLRACNIVKTSQLLRCQ